MTLPDFQRMPGPSRNTYITGQESDLSVTGTVDANVTNTELDVNVTNETLAVNVTNETLGVDIASQVADLDVNVTNGVLSTNLMAGTPTLVLDFANNLFGSRPLDVSDVAPATTTEVNIANTPDVNITNTDFPEGETFHLGVTAGNRDGYSVVHKFGRNSSVGSNFTPVCNGGAYRTPQVSGATTLRVKSGGDANDTAAGSGARSVTLQGLDATGALVSETIATAGTSASAYTTTEFIRLFRLFVASSGTYASATAASHADDIVIEDGTNDWAVIDATDFARGQSQIGVYSIPLGYRGFVERVEVSTQSNKVVDLNFYSRENILETAAPYTAMKLKRELVGIEGNSESTFPIPKGPYPALTDIGFMAKVSTGSADVSVDFTILLEAT